MEPFTPEQARFAFHGGHLPVLKMEHRSTKAVIAAIPLDKSDYRPDQISKSAIDLAWHIAVSEIRFMDCVLDGAFDMTPRPMPDSIQTSADVAAWYTENFTGRIEKLLALSGDQLAKMIDFRGMFQMPAVMFLSLGVRHSVHHRGQLSTYLRPMGAKVPSIYGESYDTAEERKAKEQKA